MPVVGAEVGRTRGLIQTARCSGKEETCRALALKISALSIGQLVKGPLRVALSRNSESGRAAGTADAVGHSQIPRLIAGLSVTVSSAHRCATAEESRISPATSEKAVMLSRLDRSVAASAFASTREAAARRRCGVV